MHLLQDRRRGNWLYGAKKDDMLNSIKEEECGITFADTDAQLSLF